MPNFYGVRSGHCPGVYDQWVLCKRQIIGFKKPIFKKFKKEKDAWDFVKSLQNVIDLNVICSYCRITSDSLNGFISCNGGCNFSIHFNCLVERYNKINAEVMGMKSFRCYDCIYGKDEIYKELIAEGKSANNFSNDSLRSAGFMCNKKLTKSLSDEVLNELGASVDNSICIADTVLFNTVGVSNEALNDDLRINKREVFL